MLKPSPLPVPRRVRIRLVGDAVVERLTAAFLGLGLQTRQLCPEFVCGVKVYGRERVEFEGGLGTLRGPSLAFGSTDDVDLGFGEQEVRGSGRLYACRMARRRESGVVCSTNAVRYPESSKRAP